MNSKNCPKIWVTLCLLRFVLHKNFCFLSCNLKFYFQNLLSFSFRIEKYESEYWFFKKFTLETSQTKWNFLILFRKKRPKKISLVVIQPQKLPNLQNVDVDSQ